MTQLRHFPYELDTAAGNMARDAVMLHLARLQDAVLWRFYGWEEPAITFGYSQRWDWVLETVQPFTGKVVRRWTGGGIVDHRRDLTYALVIPQTHSLYRQPATDLYRDLHRRIEEALKVNGIASRLAPCPGNCGPKEASGGGICFQSSEPYDVIEPDSGAKLAGAAMKRNRDGVLIQGSLLLPENSPALRGTLIHSFGEGIPAWLRTPSSEEAEGWPWPALRREMEQYSSPLWNKRR